MNILNEDLITEIIIKPFIGENDVDRIIGTFGSVCKRWLTMTRQRWVWELYYWSTFPPTKPDYTQPHIGPCSRNSCRVYLYQYQSPYHRVTWHETLPLDQNGFIMLRNKQTGDVETTKYKCKVSSHYPHIDRPKTGRFKDMFHYSAKRYINKNISKIKSNYDSSHFKWQIKRAQQQIENAKRQIEEYEKKKIEAIRIRENTHFHRFTYYDLKREEEDRKQEEKEERKRLAAERKRLKEARKAKREAAKAEKEALKQIKEMDARFKQVVNINVV